MGFFDFFKSKKNNDTTSSSRKNSLPALTVEEHKEILADVEKEIYSYDEEVSRDVWHLFGKGWSHSGVDSENISAGWAFTKDSFCLGGKFSIVYRGNLMIPYEKIIDVSFNPIRDEATITYNVYDENVLENIMVNEEFSSSAGKPESGYEDKGGGKKSLSLRDRAELSQAYGKDFKILCNYLQAVMNFYK